MLIPQPCGSCTTQCKFKSQTCAWLQILIGSVHPHPWGKFFFLLLLFLYANGGTTLAYLFIKDETFGVPAVCSGDPFPASCGARAKVLLLVLMCAPVLNSHTPLTHLLSPSLAATTSSQCFQLSSSCS